MAKHYDELCDFFDWANYKGYADGVLISSTNISPVCFQDAWCLFVSHHEWAKDWDYLHGKQETIKGVEYAVELWNKRAYPDGAVGYLTPVALEEIL